jgi:hypothetical protein
MGWHYILTFKCKVLPEFISFIENRYFDSQFDEENDKEYMFRPSWMDSYELTKNQMKHKEEYEKRKDDEKKIREKEYNDLPKSYKDIIDIWNNLQIGSHFYEYELTDDIFFCKISKKVNWHSGLLHDDYETFLKDIIVHMTSEIIECDIESDDYGNMKWFYSDSQLRDNYFKLEDKSLSVQPIFDHR